ncbi:Hypothetical_protein [Hexamita inflata]|uniref:Hypothetical_protein n=1 Tax=Hexamita inflata TaxID=28002 RepID=A0AA86N897_9EUKA|nr:Hypothetical protein HINF_LOCUS2330 [Hexamita inflata]
MPLESSTLVALYRMLILYNVFSKQERELKQLIRTLFVQERLAQALFQLQHIQMGDLFINRFCTQCVIQMNQCLNLECIMGLLLQNYQETIKKYISQHFKVHIYQKVKKRAIQKLFNSKQNLHKKKSNQYNNLQINIKLCKIPKDIGKKQQKMAQQQ